jgi:phage gp36-like protein
VSYCTRTDIQTIYGAPFVQRVLPDLGLPEDAAPEVVGAAEDAVIARACAEAGAEIDGYLGRRYRLPLAAVPEHLTAIAVDIAVYRMANTHDRLSDEISKRYENARKTLRDIADGKAGLGLAEPAAGDGTPPPASAEFFSRERRGW